MYWQNVCETLHSLAWECQLEPEFVDLDTSDVCSGEVSCHHVFVLLLVRHPDTGSHGQRGL